MTGARERVRRRRDIRDYDLVRRSSRSRRSRITSSNGHALDWIVAEAPFELAEKTETVLGLDPVGGPLYVPGEWVPAEAETVAAFGKRAGADYVVTGWFD